jgi:hypothetical protein
MGSEPGSVGGDGGGVIVQVEVSGIRCGSEWDQVGVSGIRWE